MQRTPEPFVRAPWWGLVGSILVTSVATLPAAADWPSDPAVNLAIADRTGEQAQPKIAVRTDGGCYISWFDNSTGGYDVYLQRLDPAGNEVWAHNGVLVANRSFSSTQDYGLDVDTAGNALLAFRDDRFTGVQITASKVSPDGVLLWGTNGIQLTNTTDFVAAPRIAGTTDGSVVVAWRQGNDTRLRKLTSSGFPFWILDTVLVDGGGSSFSVSDLHASDAGSVIIGLVRGFMGATLYAQKISSTGGQMWGASPIAIFDGGSLQNGNFPTFVPDGAGGAVFAWYGVGPLQVYGQHVLANGSESFPHNGVVGSTNLTRLRVSPAVAYDPATDSVFLFWTELNSLQSMWGLYGQRLNEEGSRSWTDEGKVLIPLGSIEITQVRTLPAGDGAMVFHAETTSPPFGKPIRATRVDSNGDFVWSPDFHDACSLASDKSRLFAAQTPRGVALLAWMDGRTDANDVYAQNVNQDGTLGRRLGDLDGDGNVAFSDLLILLGDWGPCPVEGDCPADLDGNMTVGFSDLLILLSQWG